MQREDIVRGTRASVRAVLGVGLLGALLPMIALQGFVIGPVFKNYETLPTFFYNSLRRLFGIKLEFNATSVPVENSRATWYVANHMSMADFLVLGSVLKGTFAGKGDIMTWPVVGQLAAAVKYIGIKRVRKDDPEFEKHHRETMGKIISNFNHGHNTIMFPEGTTTDGSIVALFRAGLLSILFGKAGLDRHGRDLPLSREVVVQPVAIRVKSVEGKSMDEREDLRRFYAHYNTTNTLQRIWTRLATREIVVELTVFPVMHPKDFKDQFELVNKAGDLVRGVVAPNQTEVKPAAIPNVDGHRLANPVAPPSKNGLA